jgi:hypothetical protein
MRMTAEQKCANKKVNRYASGEVRRVRPADAFQVADLLTTGMHTPAKRNPRPYHYRPAEAALPWMCSADTEPVSGLRAAGVQASP